MVVKVISRHGKSLLVEWVDGNGRYRRGYVPKTAVVDNVADPSVLAMAVPYGVDWDDCIEPVIAPSAAAIANELRRNGIYTLEDARNNGGTAVAALMRVYGIGLGLLVEAAEKCKEA